MENLKGAEIFARLDKVRYSDIPDTHYTGWEAAWHKDYHRGKVERDVKIPTADCPEKRAFLKKVGVNPDAHGTVRLYIKPKHSVLDSGFPAFGGYFNILEGWAVIEHVYYENQEVYGTNHPRAERIFASEWFYQFWRWLAVEDPSYTVGRRGELPLLRTVVLSQVSHEVTKQILHALSTRSEFRNEGCITADGSEAGNPGGEAARPTGLRLFRHLFGQGMGSFLVRAVTDHHMAFRNVRPVEVAWRYTTDQRRLEDPFVGGRRLDFDDVYMAVKFV
ncbi:hypothetical protein MAPG_10444 [Magnaporthiopsis poae ATCC 64411]|uniref:Uncharacterized protein n=1 Tax=Magnaporthiopsis poae (strain ATCC 64411 / 73-15) TaxID=644358 RepID=A0A0C4ECL5_MAGP6|nr:hypothetical protein MAPG_10444 [Magnaporthiopsis poae ATCC 64411]